MLQGTDFIYEIVFQNDGPKDANLGILFLHQTWQLDKFECADFKYDNGIFNFQHKNTQIKQFWSKI